MTSFVIGALLVTGKATCILLIALLGTALLRDASAGARHLVWLGALCALLLLPATTVWAPVRVAVLPPSANTVAAGIGDGGWGTGDRLSTAGASRSAAVPRLSVPRPQPPVPASSRPSLVRSLELLWALVAAGILTWLAVGTLRVRRIVRGARPLDGSEWRGQLYELADRVGLAEPPRLVGSDEVRMPFACGLRRPTVVLPRGAAEWSAERRRAVLLHELAHVRRRDLAWHTLGRIACALYWFHPLVWRAAARLRSESERACDDLVLTCGARASTYAEELLEIVCGARGDATPAPALAMARPRELEGRILAILDPATRRAGPSRRQVVRGLVIGGTVAATVAAVVPTPRAAIAAAVRTSEAVVRQGTAARETTSLVTDRVVPDRLGRERVVRDSGRASARARPTADTAQPTASTSGPRPAPEPAPSVAVTPFAVRFAGDDTTGRARAALLANVLRSDTSADLRRVAAWGLSRYRGDAAATTALVAALRSDRDAEVREMAAWALAGRDVPEARDAIVAAVRDPDAKVRTTAIWAATQSGSIEPSMAVAALGDADAEVRSAAAWALGHTDADSAPARLVALLDDPSEDVREHAVWALFRIRDERTAPALTAALQRERKSDIKREIIYALGALGEKSTAVITRLVDSTDPETRALAIRVLAGERPHVWPMPWPMPRPQP